MMGKAPSQGGAFVLSPCPDAFIGIGREPEGGSEGAETTKRAL